MRKAFFGILILCILCILFIPISLIMLLRRIRILDEKIRWTNRILNIWKKYWGKPPEEVVQHLSEAVGPDDREE